MLLPIYTHIYFLNHKNEAVERIKAFVEMVKTQFKKKPKKIRPDREREYINKDTWEKKESTCSTAAYSPQQYSVAERKNIFLLEMAGCILLDVDLAKKYWGKAVNTTNYLQNRLQTKAIGKIPYELWYSRTFKICIFLDAVYTFSIHKE